MNQVKIQNTPFVRDLSNRVLINTDEKEKELYYAKVKAAKSEKEEINKVKSELDSVQRDMKEIKDLLLQLLDKG
jgi:hypothetical protein